MRIVYIGYGILTPTRAHNLQTVATVDALAARGHAVTFINPRLYQAGASETNLPICPTMILPAGRLFALHKSRTRAGRFWSLFLDRSGFALRAIRQLRAAAPDVVITRDLVVCFWLLVLKRIVRAPVVYELHTLEQVMFDADEAAGGSVLARRIMAVTQTDFAGNQDDPSWPGRAYKKFLRHIEAWTVRNAALVLTLTAATQERLRRQFAVQDACVVPSGHALAAATFSDKRGRRARLRLDPARRIAIYAGLSMHGKGLDLLFAVARHLPADCLILVVGEQPETCARLAGLCCELGVSGMVFRPVVPHGQVAEYLLAADLGLLLYPPSPYLAEFSSPVKLFEYLACGLPVIATALPALQEIVEDGINGRLVAPDDPETIAAVIADTARDECLLRRLGAGALASARRYHYVERARRIEAAVAACLGRQSIAEDSRCFST